MTESQNNFIQSSAYSTHRGPRLWFRETPDGIVSRSLAWLGWPLMACGIALLVCVLACISRRGPLWVPLVVGGGFVVAGLVCAMSRHAFALRWSQRTWYESRGMLSWTVNRQGTFDDFAAVVLSEHRRPGVVWPARFWVVGLVFREQPLGVDLWVFSSRAKARAQADSLAHKMGLPAIDTSAR